MQQFPVPIPDSMALALKERPTQLCDIDALLPETLYFRGMARMLNGRFDQARADFLAALPQLGDACRLELALLDARKGTSTENNLATLRQISERAAAGSALMARAFHAIGFIQNDMRKTDPAMDALLKASEIYGTLGDSMSRAQVYDTMGMVQEARGRLDYAMYFLALSLVDKSLAGDQSGLGITLGNLGRVHLRAGRYNDALECFRRDLEIATSQANFRAQARMHDDIGRAHLGLSQFEPAREAFARCIKLSKEMKFSDMEFFARKDAALCLTAENKLKEAKVELDTAAGLIQPGIDPYKDSVLAAARGEWLLASGDKSAVEVLQEAVNGFVAADLPDLEIPTRISLAKAMLERKLKQSAEACLLAGLNRARADGYARYLPDLNEAMTQLNLVEGAEEESARHVAIDSQQASSASYVVRAKLGEGAFGEVFRVYDPERSREVALKRLHLEKIYDLKQRNRLFASAKVELEAASRVRHPGVVRVYAVGNEAEGSAYVVQEFVQGQPLRKLMPEDQLVDAKLVFRYAAQIASALAALHEANVVHRDLKPENVLVRGDGTPVLVDFGIAQMIGQAGNEDLLAGTLEYMAPEQAAGKKVDGRADLYALGVIVYEWLAGVRPLRLRGTQISGKIEDLLARHPNPIKDFRPTLGAAAETLIGSLLSKSPRKRPGTAQETADIFAALAEQG